MNAHFRTATAAAGTLAAATALVGSLVVLGHALAPTARTGVLLGIALVAAASIISEFVTRLRDEMAAATPTPVVIPLEARGSIQEAA